MSRQLVEPPFHRVLRIVAGRKGANHFLTRAVHGQVRATRVSCAPSQKQAFKPSMTYGLYETP